MSWESARCLAKFNELSGRPVSNDPMTDAAKYQRLTDAQNEVIQDIAPRAPKSLVSKAVAASTPTLTTTDNKIFTFGTDANGDPLVPIGRVRIFPALTDIPDHPWVENVDYLNEVTQIRIPNNRTYSGTLYWRGMAPVADITASVAPSLQPPPARVLICYKAVEVLGREATRDSDLADRMKALYDEAFARWCLVWKTQMSSGDGRGIVSGLDWAMLWDF